MALTYNSLEALTTNYIIPKLRDNFFKSNVIFWKFKQGGLSHQGGLKIMQPVEYAGTTAAGSYTGYDSLSTVDNERFTKAYFDWKQNYVSITYSGLEDMENAGKEQVLSLIKKKTENARKTLEDNLGYQLFSDGSTASTHGRGTKGITGLQAAVDDGTNTATYGGIERLTDATWWKASYTNASATAITLKAIQGWLGDVTDGAMKPNLAICGQDVWDHIWGLMQPQQRFQDSKMADAGFTNLLVSGVPLTTDSHCASTDMWLLYMDSLDLVTHGARDFKYIPFRRPTNQDAEVAQILWAGNLTCDECRRNHRIVNLDVTL